MPQQKETFIIGRRRIGAHCPCFIIAEAGVNHNGDMDIAEKMIDAAAEAGADAVKFQIYKTTKVYTAHTPKAGYMLKTTRTDRSIMEMARRLELPCSAFAKLARHCQRRGIIFLASAFDEESADFLAKLRAPAIKIPSGELTNLPFLEHTATLGLPLIVSTGMAALGEVESALSVIRKAGNPPVALLHCVSNYPAAPETVNLRAMHTLRTAFHVPVGFSDHTVGHEIAAAAVALGAVMLEKHFTLDKTLPGPDHQASLEPQQLAEFVAAVRRVESALGSGIKQPAEAEADTARVARKSIVAIRNIPAGVKLQRRWLALKRPGTGLPATLLPFVTGRITRCRIPLDTLISLDMLR